MSNNDDDETIPNHLASLIENHKEAIRATYDALPVQKDRDLFLMGLRSSLQKELPSAMGSPCIHSSVVDCIGKTKLVRLGKIQSAILNDAENNNNSAAEVVAKLEFTNPGGSVKDRIAKSMLLAAEKEGTIQPYVSNSRVE